MKKLLFSASALLVIVALCGGMFWYVPQKIEKKALTHLKNAGFISASVGSIERKTGRITFKNIKLTPDDFSNIGEIIVEYSPFDALTNGNKAKNITIKNLHLTGEYSEKDKSLKIDGWNSKDNALRLSLYDIPAQTIKIEKGDIDLLTKKFGGLKLEYDLEIKHTEKNETKISGLIESRQKKLSFRSRLKGTISNKQTLNLTAKTTKVQIHTDTLSVNRANGQINLKILKNSPPDISLEANAGALTWEKIPMGEIGVTLNIIDDKKTLHVQGQTIGQERIEFAASMTQNGDKTAYDLSLHPKKFENLSAFCMRHHLLSKNTVLPDLLLRMRDPTLTLDKTESDQTLHFTLAGRDHHFEIIGKAALDSKTRKITGEFDLPETIISQNATHIFTMTKKQKSLTPAPSEFPPEEDLALSMPAETDKQNTLKAKLTGKFNATLENNQVKDLTWEYDTNLTEGTLHIGPVALKGMQKNFFESYPAQKKAKNNNQTQAAFHIELKDSIKQNGTLTLTPGLSSPSPHIDTIKLDVYKGHIKIEPPSRLIQNRLPKNTVLQVSDINLKSLFRDIDINGIEISGKLGGRLPLTLKNGKIFISDGILQSQQKGTLKLSKEITEKIFVGENAQMKTIREALKNYRYEYFEIRLDGELSDRVLMSLTADGYNPGYLNKRPIELSLQVETKLHLLLKNLMKQSSAHKQATPP